MSTVLRSLLREPLVHVLLGGAALFGLHALVADGSETPRERIVVGEARIESLADAFARTWMRPPTRRELEGLIDDYVTEEVLYREALALGLDRDDLVVRRRMRQKMEFLHEDLVEAAEPDDAVLRAFLEANPERFRIPERVTLRQVFVSAERRTDPEAHAAALLAQLRAPGAPEPGTLGDATLLPAGLEDASRDQVARAYGEAFAEAVAGLPEGAWSGPIASDFGLHLVRVASRVPGRMPALDEVRAQVAREWEAEQRQAARERLYRAMRERYEVEVRMPDADGDEAVASRDE
jgi:hypothetical protein